MDKDKLPVYNERTFVEHYEDTTIECSVCDFEDPKEWTVITALDRIVHEARNCRLTKQFWASIEAPLAYMRECLAMTDMQILLLGVMVEEGAALTWKMLGEFLGCTRISIMVYTDDIDELVKRRWISRCRVDDDGVCYDAFRLEYGVVRALRHNKPYQPERLDGFDEQRLVERLRSFLSQRIRRDPDAWADHERWLTELAEANPSLPLCHEAMRYADEHVRSLLLLAVANYASCGGNETAGLPLGWLDCLYPNDWECDYMRTALRDGNHPLQRDGWLEYKCDNGMVDTTEYVLTARARAELIGSYTTVVGVGVGDSSVVRYTTIKPKSLFYNAADQGQIDHLVSLLSQKSFADIQARLAQAGMRTGFACLFYGAPGTGKSETARQLARLTHRNIVQVDIAGLRDKYVGESEKNIKEVFASYKRICRRSKSTPILLFNEADAIIGKRLDNVKSSVEKMDNAMQNILLQEIEDFEGILIATTNLTGNLDSAFERRFLFKVEFHKPEPKVKAKIWASMLDNLTEAEAGTLAARYDFSGGQIENIARKSAVGYVLNGRHATFAEIDAYCRAEVLDRRTALRPVVGFAS